MKQWPRLNYAQDSETYAALHLWSQIVGKVRLANVPWINHSWHATLQVNPRGLTTGPVHHDTGTMEIVFDLQEHRLVVESFGAKHSSFALDSMSVADFLALTKEAVEATGAGFDIHDRPNELPEAIPFAENAEMRPYDRDAVERLHGALLDIDRVFRHFRTGFIGKVSPAHLFWGSFDFAVTRFSGREATPHPGGIPNLPDDITREAYSHEVSSAGFWPGGGGVDEAMFYSYAYPGPTGFAERSVEPDAAFWNSDLGEFLLPYEAVRSASDPDEVLLSFLQSTYEAAAETADWDRAALECPLGVPRRPRVVIKD